MSDVELAGVKWFAKALADHSASGGGGMTLRAGDVLAVLDDSNPKALCGFKICDAAGEIDWRHSVRLFDIGHVKTVKLQLKGDVAAALRQSVTNASEVIRDSIRDSISATIAACDGDLPTPRIGGEHLVYLEDDFLKC